MKISNKLLSILFLSPTLTGARLSSRQASPESHSLDDNDDDQTLFVRILDRLDDELSAREFQEQDVNALGGIMRRTGTDQKDCEACVEARYRYGGNVVINKVTTPDAVLCDSHIAWCPGCLDANREELNIVRPETARYCADCLARQGQTHTVGDANHLRARRRGRPPSRVRPVQDSATFDCRLRGCNKSLIDGTKICREHHKRGFCPGDAKQPLCPGLKGKGRPACGKHCRREDTDNPYGWPTKQCGFMLAPGDPCSRRTTNLKGYGHCHDHEQMEEERARTQQQAKGK